MVAQEAYYYGTAHWVCIIIILVLDYIHITSGPTPSLKQAPKLAGTFFYVHSDNSTNG